MNNLEYTQEYEMIVRDLTDTGVSRKEAEKIALSWMKELVK